MCYVKNAGELKTYKQVVDTIRYLGNPSAMSHAFYRVEVPVALASATVANFVFESINRRDAHNDRRPKNNARSGIATWFIFSFDEGSFVTPSEAALFRTRVGKVIAPSDQAVFCRHEHYVSGSSDENILVPTITSDGEELHPRRAREQNELFRLRHAVAKIIAELNGVRAEEGRAPIPTPQQQPSKFIRACADAAIRRNLVPNASNLTQILQHAAPKKTWYFDARDFVCFPPKKKRGRTKRIPRARILHLIHKEMEVTMAAPPPIVSNKATENRARNTHLSKLHGCITPSNTPTEFSSTNNDDFEPET